MKVNGIEIKAKEFAYDRCHKIYLLENEVDKKEAIEIGYDILPIKLLKAAYDTSCGLKFIETWHDFKRIVAQFEDAVFEGFEECA